MGMSSMGAAKLHVIYGLPLSKRNRNFVDHTMICKLSDDATEEMDAAFVKGVKPGLMSFGSPNNATVVFGIHIKAIDLNKEQHHSNLIEVESKEKRILALAYNKLWKDLSPTMKKTLKKLNREEPSLIMVLAEQ